MSSIISPEFFQLVIRETLVKKLKERFMIEAEKVVDETVDALQGDISLMVEQYRNVSMFEDVLRVIVEDKRN